MESVPNQFQIQQVRQSFKHTTVTVSTSQNVAQPPRPQKWSFTCETVRAESADLVIVHLEDFHRWRKCWNAAEPVAIQIQLLQKGQTLKQIRTIKQSHYFNSSAWSEL